jgi:diguanylate cyclase (GGDEF)-like protein
MTSELAELKERLRHNERIWNGFRAIELALIGADSLRAIFEIFTRQLPRQFTGVHRITLACLDPFGEIEGLVRQENPLATGPRESTSGTRPDGFIPLSDTQLSGLYPKPYRPYLGPRDPSRHDLLFPGNEKQPASLALVPLVLRGELIGSLNQGSAEADHFGPEAATDLLEHLAAVTAVCLENRLNHERLKIDGLTDAVTGIANRRFFERRLSEEVSRVQRTGKPLSCAMVDVDHFKALNDSFGHRAGDRALHGLAQLLGAELRTIDVLARYGGEEFVLLLPETRPELAGTIAERLRRRIASGPIMAATGPLSVTVSIGCASLDADRAKLPRSREWLVEQADSALYRAKKLGRNRVVLAGETAIPELR